MAHRLPKRVYLGRGYYVDVSLMSAKDMKEMLEEDDHTCDGFWMAEFSPPDARGNRRAGRIVVWNKLSVSKKWEVYWHELDHALNDITAADRTAPVLT